MKEGHYGEKEKGHRGKKGRNKVENGEMWRGERRKTKTERKEGWKSRQSTEED